MGPQLLLGGCCNTRYCNFRLELAVLIFLGRNLPPDTGFEVVILAAGSDKGGILVGKLSFDGGLILAVRFVHLTLMQLLLREQLLHLVLSFLARIAQPREVFGLLHRRKFALALPPLDGGHGGFGADGSFI